MAEETQRGYREWSWLAVVFCLALAAQLATFYLIPDGQMNDDAAYAMRALQMVDAERYANARSPADLRPGWPLAMGASLFVGGKDLRAARILTSLLTAVNATFLCLLVWKRSRSRLLGFLVALLFMQAPLTLQLGSSLMSEPLYYCVLLSVLTLSTRASSVPALLALGVLSGWCISIRSDGFAALPVIALALLMREDRWKRLAIWFAALASFQLLLRSMIEDRAVHYRQLTGILAEGGYKLDYLWNYFTLNSKNAYQALEGSPAAWDILFWPALLFAVGFALWKRRPNWALVARDPILVWLVAYPTLLILWPYFAPRYWVLWSSLALGTVLSYIPIRVGGVVLSLLVLLQLPASFHQYQNGPIARTFQNTVYLPFYREFSDHGNVMTLNFHRLELLSKATATEPVESADFSSVPLAMAQTDTRYIEWEQKSRELKAYDGVGSRLYPPYMPFQLRSSTLYEHHHGCRFSDCFELKVPQEDLLKVLENLRQLPNISQAQEQLELYNETLDIVKDLPEIRIQRAILGLKLDPSDERYVSELIEVYEQYPNNYQNGLTLLKFLQGRGRQQEVQRLAELAIETIKRDTPQEATAPFEVFLNP